MTDGDERDPIHRTALVAATLPLLVFGAGGNYEQPDVVHFTLLALGAVGLAGALLRKSWAGPLVLLAVLALGVYLRAVAGETRASDVMVTTNEAIRVLSAGGNPYAHVYAMTEPPGGLFGYPPGEIAFYLLWHIAGADLFRVDLMCGILMLGMIAALSPLIGEGLCALAIGSLAASGDVIFHATDGSNDTAAAFLVIAGVTALAWALALRGRIAAMPWWLSAIAFGWSVAFKEYTLPIVVFVGLFLWRRDARPARGWASAAAGTFALFTVPFFAWNPGAFVANVGGALLVHHNVWGRNLWHDVAGFAPGYADALAGAIPAIALAAFAAAVVAFWRRPAPNLGAALLQGCAAIAIVFALSRWTTSVYWVFFILVVPTGVALTLAEERPASREA